MKVFDCANYRQFIRIRVKESAGGGHGEYRRISEFLRIPSSMMSQVMSGKRELSLESASLLCDYFSLSELEADYLLNLVELERAGSALLKERIRKRLTSLSKKSTDLSHRIAHEKKLSEEEKTTFYSHWYYSGVRLASSIEGINNASAIADLLKLPRTTVQQVLEFLLSAGLCVEEKGKIKNGPKSTHIGNDSPMLIRHHLNWRLKVMSQLTKPKDHEVVFTGPVTLSQEACVEVKKKILHLIDEWGEIADRSKEEKLACLNIDWVDIT